MKSFEGSFRNLNFSPSTSILLNLSFPCTDIPCFFSSFIKLQYCRKIVWLNFSKKPLFQKRYGDAISRQDKRQLPKSTARFPAKKRWHSPPPVGLSWGSPPLPPESVRAGGRAYADVTTKISRVDRLG